MSRDMRTVYRAFDLWQADVIVAWLEEHGISALVKDRLTAGILPTSLIVAPQGIEVCVMDPDEAERAIALLRDHYKPEGRAGQSEDDSRTIEAVCEECGKTASFPYAQRGAVQHCPHCGAHMDVPDEAEGPDA
ncbi:MAG: DUF2007 domain-containing protein [Phycisphaerae bacterium]|nr:DUF2007 domain-containing protein [Phycisphaerae bacterium]